MACSVIGQEFISLRNILCRLSLTDHAGNVVVVYNDNTTVLAYIKDPKYHKKSKHIERKYHYIQDMVTQGGIILRHIFTCSIMADPLTKPTGRDVFRSHIGSIGLHRI